jgi:serine/threonine-protein kinase
MLRPDGERRFLRLAQQRGYLRLEEAATLVEELEERGLCGLHALRDLAVRMRFLSERTAYDLFVVVSRELREVPAGIARIGGYEVLERIGRGSMGVVYRARQVSLEKEVALKVLPPRLSHDPTFVERFLREARAAGRLNHPNVVAALDAGYADGFHYFAMELVQGSSLKEIVDARGPVEEREALKVAFFVAKALRHAHGAGIIHRDVKPANVMVTSDGRVKLTDLGLARKMESADCSLTQHGKSVGTPYYMSPEQAVEERRVDARCDVYALGCTLFYALAGVPPYDGPTPSSILAKHVSAPIPDPRDVVPTVGEAAARLVMRMMAKRPDARPQTAREVGEALRTILARPDAPAPAQTFEAIAPVAPPAQSQSLESFWVGRGPAQPGVGEALANAAATAAPALRAAEERRAAASEAKKKRRPAPGESNISLMELAPVSSASVRRLRRQAGTGSARVRSRSTGGAVAVAVGAVLLAIGALTYAFTETGGDERRTTAGKPVRAEDGASAIAAATSRARGESGPARPASPSKSQEVLDREAAERDAPLRDAEHAAVEAQRSGAEAERLAAAAHAKQEAEARRAAEAAARVDAAEAKKQADLLAEIAPKLAQGKVDDALAEAEQAAKAYANAPVRARAERDAAAIRAALDLRALALEALAAKEGKRAAIELRSGTTIEGEVASVARESGTVTIRVANGGSFAIDVRAIADASIAEIVRSALGFHHPPFLLAEGLRVAYAGDLAKGRALVAQAAERGQEDAPRFLARLDEIAKERGLALARADAPPPVAAPPAAPAAPATEAVDGEKDEPTVALSQQVLLRLFETQPESFSPDGHVRWRYVFLSGQKKLGADWDIAGLEPRFDTSLGCVRLEGEGARVTHRAVFQGDVRIETDLVYLHELGRGAALSLFLEDVKNRQNALESLFGIALVDRRKGKVAAFSGPVNAPEVACRELKDHAAYVAALGVEGGTALTTLDGAVRGHVEGAPCGTVRRAGFAFDHVGAALRSVTIEGRLDLHWVARELARRAGMHAGR